MSEDPLTNFTDKLLSEKTFACGACGNLLQPPIILVESIGNVCDNCAKTNTWTGIPNLKLEKVLSELKIPCKFNTNGCKERIQFNNLQEHENHCKFHAKPCVMGSVGCDWKGVQSQFSNHFMQTHNDHVLTSQYGTFIIDINTEKSNDIIKLLKGKHETIIIIKIDKESDSIQYTVCDLNNSETMGELIVKHMAKSDNCVETKCKISSMSDVKMSKINLTALKGMIETENIITIQIKMANGDESKEFDEQTLQYFECPVCKSLMKPPIYQCKFGHSVCGNCRSKLEKCPNCRALYGTTRNYSLEGLTANLSYSCMFHHLGCEENFSVNELNKHETICPYKPYACPLDDCAFRGTHFNIGDHLSQVHQDKVIASNYYKTTVEFRVEQMIDFYNYQQKFFMMFDENIFKLSFKRNSDYSFWAVEVLRKKDESAVFIYEIGLIDMRKTDRRLIRSDLCFQEINSDELFKKCILFPNNILASYACNGLFTYYCQIRERN